MTKAADPALDRIDHFGKSAKYFKQKKYCRIAYISTLQGVVAIGAAVAISADDVGFAGAVAAVSVALW